MQPFPSLKITATLYIMYIFFCYCINEILKLFMLFDLCLWSLPFPSPFSVSTTSSHSWVRSISQVQNWYEIDLQLFTFFGKQDFKFCVNFLPCNTYLEFMRNNKFAITIVVGRTLPFPLIFQSGEFVKQVAYCFHFLNGKFYCYTYG